MATTRFVFLMLTFALFTTTIDAFQISPMSLEFTSNRSGATRTLKIMNNTKKAVPVEIVAYARTHSLDGVEARKRTGDFIIYPQQVIMQPGQKRNIRVTYIGGADITQEKAYRLFVKQVPISFSERTYKVGKSEANIGFLFEYWASMYVAPPKSAPALIVENLKRSKKDELIATFRNAGTKHTLLRDYKLKLAVKNGFKELDVANFKGGTINILSGETRRYRVKLPKNTHTEVLRMKVEAIKKYSPYEF